MSDRYAGLPISDDDAAIAAALEDVSVPTLLVSLVHRVVPTIIPYPVLTIEELKHCPKCGKESLKAKLTVMYD